MSEAKIQVVSQNSKAVALLYVSPRTTPKMSTVCHAKGCNVKRRLKGPPLVGCS